MYYLLWVCAALFLLGCHCQTVDVLYAINCAGPKYTSLNGITYEANYETEHDFKERRYFSDLSGPDQTIYKTYRYNMISDDESWMSLNISLPLTGDGWYGLVLQQMSESTHELDEIFSARLNSHTILKDYHPHATRKCAIEAVCDTVVYFSICNGVFYRHGQRMEMPEKKLVLFFTTFGFLDALVLTKGVAGARKTVMSGKTEIYFDPAQERKCVKS
jgi:Malectin domain